MAVPTGIWDAGWYKFGPAPGSPGDAVLDGHLDWYTGSALFARLGSLRPGDTIVVVKPDGARLQFQVDSLDAYAYDARVPGLFANTGDPRLSLITCSGTWDYSHQTYSKRLIVNARLV